MTLSVIVPWRTDHGPRERAWNWIRPHWENLGVELVVVDDPDPGQWSTARAIRAGMDQVTGHKVTVYGADHIPDPGVLAAAERILDEHAWCYLYDDVAYATEESTALLCAGRITADQLDWGAHSGCCVGMWAFTRHAWTTTGGVDPRFIGWGYGDDAWNLVLEATFGPSPARPGHMLRELWHPGIERDTTATNPNRGLYEREYLPYRGNTERLLAIQERW